MASRYEGNATFTNTLDLYRNVFRKRGVKQIEQYATQELEYPKRGDHYYKLADFYYGDPTYWWVIAQFNQKPTEDQITFGDIIMIPTPLETILTIYGV
jgi:hypothetical protein